MPGVVESLPFLIGNVHRVLGTNDPAFPYIDVDGKRVVVLGGGDTAMDCVRTSIRQGAFSVTCAYRRDEANMPGSRKEVETQRTRGSSFCSTASRSNSSATARSRAYGWSKRNWANPMTTAAAPGADRGQRAKPAGRRRDHRLRLSPGSTGLAAEHGIETLENGRIAVGASGLVHQTTNEKVFAGGDMVRGADLVVTAVFEGREAAKSIAKKLGVEVMDAMAAEVA